MPALFGGEGMFHCTYTLPRQTPQSCPQYLVLYDLANRYRMQTPQVRN